MRPNAVLPLIDVDEVASTAEPLALVDALRQNHRHGVQGLDRSYLVEQLDQTTERGLLVWPAWQYGRALGAKLATIFPDNEARGLGPNIRSVYVLFDGLDGAPLAILTGESFTRWKTAADLALAATYLAREDASHLVVLGAGAQAHTHVRFLRSVRPSLQRVSIWNCSMAKAEELTGHLRQEGIEAAAVEDRAAAVRGADIVSCLTASTIPVLEGAWLRAGAHVDLVGGFTPAMRESDDEAILRARVFVDYRGLVTAHCGDISDPLARGILRPADVLGDLFDLCGGAIPGRTSPAEITLFKNGGGGHLDLMAAMAFYEAAKPSCGS